MARIIVQFNHQSSNLPVRVVRNEPTQSNGSVRNNGNYASGHTLVVIVHGK